MSITVWGQMLCASTRVPGQCRLTFAATPDAGATALLVTYTIVSPPGAAVTFGNGSTSIAASIPLASTATQVDYLASFAGSCPPNSFFTVGAQGTDTSDNSAFSVTPGSVQVQAPADPNYLVDALVTSAMREGALGARAQAGTATVSQYQQAQAAREAAHQAVRKLVSS